MKTLLIVKYAFVIIGAGMLIGAFYLFNNTQDFVASAQITNGTVIDLVRSRSSDSTTYRPVVEFSTQNGSSIEFTSSTGSNPPGYSTGETVEVLYQESFPEQARIKGYFSLWGAPTILGGIGSVFFLVGFSMIMAWRNKKKKIEYLKTNGVPIKAKLQHVGVNSSLEVNGRNPYQILSQWTNPATAEVHVFTSDNIWFDPSDHIKGDDITVLIERNNPKKYHVDLSFLPKSAE